MEALGEVGRAIETLISALTVLTPWLWCDLGAIVPLHWWERALRRAGQLLAPVCLSLSSWIQPGRSLGLPAEERSGSRDKHQKPILPSKFTRDLKNLRRKDFVSMMGLLNSLPHLVSQPCTCLSLLNEGYLCEKSCSKGEQVTREK